MELKELPEAAIPKFREGISLLLARWSALQMAVDNEWGGPNSRTAAFQLASEIFDFFTLSKETLYIDDLEDLLDKAMITLNTDVQDGSIEEVAEKLMVMHEECLEGNYGSVEKLREDVALAVTVRHIEQVANDEDEATINEDISNMILDAPELPQNSNPTQAATNETKTQMMEETDGWVTVASRKSKGRKKVG
ncbi:hypothetical protein Nepgr_025589 [Nepenthes gracilis]|uniref:Pre-rRNA-processing protein TSR2 homolog n=1 Tax=Nepenthes gracilis TaxID=150966 RepID=A0AAD3Y1N1_NEPGR|nr:hypothetical protein Nepgr_025589 [Nepenthes gracilis]